MELERGFRILNGGVSMRGRTINVAKPQVVAHSIRGLHFFYDANAMTLLQVSKEVYDNWIEQKKMPPHIMEKLGSQASLQVSMLPVPATASSIVLEVTHLCNLNCRYCFVRAYYDDQGARMSFGVVKRALFKLANPRDGNKDLRIGFFGGEPLINFRLIQKVVEYCKTFDRKKKITHSVTTNGTLLDERKVAFFKEHDFSFIVSIDGPEEIHNRNRPMKRATDTRNSFQQTMCGLKLLRAADLGKRVTLRSTFTANDTNLLERLKFMNKLVYDGFGGHVSVEPASMSESHCVGEMEGAGISPECMRGLEKEYVECADWMLSEIKAGRAPKFHHAYMHVQRIYNRLPGISECGAGKGYLSVGAAGDIYACHREDVSHIGTLNAGFNEQDRAQWLDNRWYARDKCPSCSMRLACGGGCRQNSLQNCGNIRKPYETECELRKIQFRIACYMMASLTDTEIQTHFPPKNKRISQDTPAKTKEYQFRVAGLGK